MHRSIVPRVRLIFISSYSTILTTAFASFNQCEEKTERCVVDPVEFPFTGLRGFDLTRNAKLYSNC